MPAVLICPFVIAKLKGVVRYVSDTDYPWISTTRRHGFCNYHWIQILLGKGYLHPVVVYSVYSAPLHGSSIFRGQATNGYSVTAIAAYVLGKDLVTKRKNRDCLVNVVYFSVFGLLLLKLDV